METKVIAQVGKVVMEEAGALKAKRDIRNAYSDYLAWLSAGNPDIMGFAFHRAAGTGREFTSIIENIRYYAERNHDVVNNGVHRELTGSTEDEILAQQIVDLFPAAVVEKYKDASVIHKALCLALEQLSK